MQTEPRPSRVIEPSELHGGVVARDHVAGAVGHGDEHLGRLHRIVQVPHRDVAPPGEATDDTGAGRHGTQIVVERE